MGLRKGSAYVKIKRAYTRKSRKKTKNYIKAVPQSKIPKFTMGDIQAYREKRFDYVIYLVTNQNIQIRDNPIEACRQLVLRHLNNKVKVFYFSLLIYPHHILRENKMLTGAGADRMQSGMKHSFGKAINLAAQMKKGSKLFVVSCNKDKLEDVHRIVALAKAKLPGKWSIVEKKLK
ncbi:MAG: 50S ribosomal protein L16 [archaeon]|nr:MAG: 50S ribosomal protein L16 [archaeon]